MEGGGGAQEQRGRRQREEKAGRQPRAGGMKFRVSARAPHGVGSLLLIGGAVLVGAAVVAWRHARRGKRDRQPAKKEVSDGGVAEDGKGGASARGIDRPDDNLRGEEEDKTEIGSKGLDKDGVAEEIQEVRDDEIVDEAEIVADESNSKRAENFDLDSSRRPVEISMHDDVDTVTVEKGDENSTKNNTENDNNSTKNDIESDQDAITNGTENENSSKNDLKKEIAPNDNEDVEEASDQSSHSINRPGILLNKQSLHGYGAQEAESMENSPTARLMIHQEQLLNDMTMETEGDTSEPKPGKGTALHTDVHKQGQQKAVAEPVGLAGSPALSSLVKPTEKKEPELQGRVETGMKIEQHYTNGGLKEHGLVTKGGVTPGGAIMTMDRRSSLVAILALMFALTIGITIVVRLYAPQRATKLQMDLQ